jgi:hypothetical protein
MPDAMTLTVSPSSPLRARLGGSTAGVNRSCRPALERLEILLEISPLEAAVDEDVIRQVVTTKFKEWEYEHELRYVEKVVNKDEETGFYYVDFSPDFELREIIAGARCERTLDDIRKQVFGNTETITMIKARAAFGTFSMVQQKMQNVLTIRPFHQAAGFGKGKWGNRKKG